MLFQLFKSKLLFLFPIVRFILMQESSQRCGSGREVLYKFPVIGGKTKKRPEFRDICRNGPKFDSINLPLVHRDSFSRDIVSQIFNLSFYEFTLRYFTIEMMFL